MGRQRRAEVRGHQSDHRPRVAVLPQARAAEAGTGCHSSRCRSRRPRRCGFPARCSPTRRASGCSSRTAITIGSSSPTLDGKLLRRDRLRQRAAGRTARSLECSFNHPQGMVLVGRHAVRGRHGESFAARSRSGDEASDDDRRARASKATPGRPKRGRYSAGRRGRRRSTVRGHLWVHGDDLYIAMAGPHQIWKMPLDRHARSGRMPAMAAKTSSMAAAAARCPTQSGFASFAQPSGLASDGERLFVADSEGSAIRSGAV